MQFRELSYANDGQPRHVRLLIRGIESLSGRRRFAGLYDIWRRDIAPTGERVFGRMLELINVGLNCENQWPPAELPDGPLVMVANHPFGIGDGIAVLAMAEQLGRPFRVMINSDLLKIREMQPYALPVDFSESKAALRNNLAVRHEALRLLKDGTVIVVFPAGGVATAPKGFGKAEDLPWKLFPARLVQEARATVIPVHFSGQNTWAFHAVSRFSMTLRIAMLIREFTRLQGRMIRVKSGNPISWPELEAFGGRQDLTGHLRRAVFALEAENSVA